MLPAARRRHPLLLLAGQLMHFFAVMLWVAAGLAMAGMPAVAIVVVVVLNGVFSFAQEYRADRAAGRLRDLLPVRATVRRDGRAVVVEAAELEVGDLVLLEAGDRVCADLRLIESSRLALDESMLTGESRPVRPEPGDVLHAGTYTVQGHAAAEVIATGAATRLAGIAAVTAGAKRPRSPLAAHLHRVVKVIAIVAIGVGVGFFVAALLLGLGTANSLLFAIGVTVALAPEGLLPTVTLSLARAAQRMARRDTLVRRLESVETLGATTFICTDKTGTLTRNEMSVFRVWTVAGVVEVSGAGYAPKGALAGDPETVRLAGVAAGSAARCTRCPRDPAGRALAPDR